MTTPDVSGLTPTAPLTVVRVGRSTYTAGNGRGAEVRIAPEGTEGSFSPGELLKIALAACNAMSADHRLVHALGEDFPSETVVVGHKDKENERYPYFEVTLTAPVQDLPEDKLPELRERVGRSVHRNCTVGRSLENGAHYEFRLAGDGE